MSASDHVALDRYLSYLEPYISDPLVSEVCVNGPGEVFIEKQGVMERHEVPDLVYDRLLRLAKQAGQCSEQPPLTDKYPLLAATLPQGARLQCVVPPATEPHRIVIAVRKQTIVEMSLDEYSHHGGYTHTQRTHQTDGHEYTTLQELYQAERYDAFIKEAIRQRCTILISGGTSSGKTVYLNACLQAIPHEERIITIEDTRELSLVHANVVPLLYPRGGEHSGRHSAKDLVEASLRLRPDRIVLGELRGAESFDFLHAINTGHPGSIATIHANTSRSALKRLCMMVLQARTGMTLPEIESYVRGTIDVIVHVARFGRGRFGVREIYFAHAEDDTVRAT